METRNGSSAGQERLSLLRLQIARIEGRPAQMLEPGKAAGAPIPAASHGDAAPEPHDLTLVREHGTPVTQTDAGLILSGDAAFDAALGGGLPRAALSELRTSQTRHAAGLSGFALALMSRVLSGQSAAPLLWLSSAETAGEAGHPYLPGIAALTGLAPGLLFEAVTSRTDDVLWVAEQAAASGAFCGILVELRGNPKALGLDETRRLHRRATLTGTPVFLLRVAGLPEPTAAPCRLLIEPARSGLRHTLAGPLEGSLGNPAFTVTIEKARAPSAPPFLLEWNRHDRSFAPPHSGTHAAAPVIRPPRPQAVGAGSGAGAGVLITRLLPSRAMMVLPSGWWRWMRLPSGLA